VRYQTFAAATRTHRLTGAGLAEGAEADRLVVPVESTLAPDVVVELTGETVEPVVAAAVSPPPATARQARPSSSALRGLGTCPR
jgi:hypothetical protein